MDLALYNDIRSALLRNGPVSSDDVLRSAFVAINDAWRHELPEARSAAERVAFLIEFLAERTIPDGESALAVFLDATATTLDEQDAGRTELTGLASKLREFVAGGGVLSVPLEARQQTALDVALALLARLPTDHVPTPDRASLPPNSRPGLDLDPNFTGREKELLELAAELKEGRAVAIGQPVAVSGLGGMGKSSLASAFLYRYGRYFAGGVFWLSFADPANIPAEIADAGSRLDIPGFDALDLPEQVAAARRAWESPMPRLLVFDNCEDESLLDRYKPVGGGCRVLVTSRSAAWDSSRGLHMLHLETLPRADSIAFLHKLAARLTAGEADAIAAELGDFPLALHLAGSYLIVASDVSVAHFLADLADESLLHPALEGALAGYSPTGHERDVFKTFSISLDRLDRDDDADHTARYLLQSAACFAPGEPVARSLLLATLPEGKDDPLPKHIPAAAFQRLLALGLLEQVGADAVRLHRLLAAFVELLGIGDNLRISAEVAVGKATGRLHESGLPVTFPSILPHLRFMTDAALARAEDAHSAWLCHHLANLLQVQGDYVSARFRCERALTIHERVRGSEHPDTAISLGNLASVLMALGEYNSARPLLERALGIFEKTLGTDHDELASTLSNLGELLRTQGDYASARPFLERAIAIRERVIGPDHADMAILLNNLAGLLKTQGDYGAARPLLERALTIREQTLGPDHPATAQGLHNLGSLLVETGDHVAAKPLLERSLAIREQVLGEDHPDVAYSLTGLAGLLKELGDFTAARPFYERALTIREQTLGADHPLTAVSLYNLASLLQAQGEYVSARPLLERALAIDEAVYGPTHPDVASDLNELALLTSASGDDDAARPLLERALTIREQTLGPSHPLTAFTLYNLASLLKSHGDLAAARPLHERALAIRERVFSDDHPQTIQSLEHTAHLFQLLGEHTAARPLYERALAARERSSNPKPLDVAQILNNLGVLLAAEGEPHDARLLLERALAIRLQALGPNHPNTQSTAYNLAITIAAISEES